MNLSRASFEKVDDTTLRVTVPLDHVAVVDVTFLQHQIDAVTYQRDTFVEARNAELADLQAMLDQCSSLNIVSKVINAESMGASVAQKENITSLKG